MCRFRHCWKPAATWQLSAGRLRAVAYACKHNRNNLKSPSQFRKTRRTQVGMRWLKESMEFVMFSTLGKQLRKSFWEIVFQTTLASQSSKCVAIDICVANVKVRRNRQMRRKRQSASQSTPLRKMRRISYQLASQSTNASQTSKYVAIDKCVANVKVRRNRQMRRKRQSASQSTIVD
jgi:hypothetical protein